MPDSVQGAAALIYGGNWQPSPEDVGQGSDMEIDDNNDTVQLKESPLEAMTRTQPSRPTVLRLPPAVLSRFVTTVSAWNMCKDIRAMLEIVPVTWHGLNIALPLFQGFHNNSTGARGEFPCANSHSSENICPSTLSSQVAAGEPFWMRLTLLGNRYVPAVISGAKTTALFHGQRTPACQISPRLSCASRIRKMRSAVNVVSTSQPR